MTALDQFSDTAISAREADLATRVRECEQALDELRSAVTLRAADLDVLRAKAAALEVKEKDEVERIALRRTSSDKDLRRVQSELAGIRAEIEQNGHDLSVLQGRVQEREAEYASFSQERQDLEYARIVGNAVQAVEESAGKVFALIHDLEMTLLGIGQAQAVLKGYKHLGAPQINPLFCAFRWDEMVGRSLRWESWSGMGAIHRQVWEQASLGEVERLTREPDPAGNEVDDNPDAA